MRANNKKDDVIVLRTYADDSCFEVGGWREGNPQGDLSADVVKCYQSDANLCVLTACSSVLLARALSGIQSQSTVNIASLQGLIDCCHSEICPAGQTCCQAVCADMVESIAKSRETLAAILLPCTIATDDRVSPTGASYSVGARSRSVHALSLTAPIIVQRNWEELDPARRTHLSILLAMIANLHCRMCSSQMPQCDKLNLEIPINQPMKYLKFPGKLDQ